MSSDPANAIRVRVRVRASESGLYSSGWGLLAISELAWASVEEGRFRGLDHRLFITEHFFEIGLVAGVVEGHLGTKLKVRGKASGGGR